MHQEEKEEPPVWQKQVKVQMMVQMLDQEAANKETSEIRTGRPPKKVQTGPGTTKKAVPQLSLSLKMREAPD